MDELLRIGPAAQRLGVHPTTLRTWANEGRVPSLRVGGKHRRFSVRDLDIYAGRISPDDAGRPRVEALYLRVSGTSGQETSLAAQEEELRSTSSSSEVRVFKDRASGLRESRPGLDKLLKAAADGKVTVVRVTHEDRLARFGVRWLTLLLAQHQVEVEVLHPKGSAGGMEELLADFTSLVATFAGRMYGIRGRDARRRLLAEAAAQVEPAGVSAEPSGGV